MGTRSVTEVRSKWGEQEEYTTHARIYRHWDGYPSSHGKWIYDFLNGRTIVNGKNGREKEPFANGPGRLAAQMVGKLLQDDHEPDLLASDGDCGQDYDYRIDIDFGMSGGQVACIRVEEFGKEVFSGGLDQYKQWLERDEEDED